LNRRLLVSAVLYLIYLIPSLYAVAGVLELVILMGHGNGTYSDYGRNIGEVLTAYAFLAINFLWLALGTVVAVRVFEHHMKLFWRVLMLVLAWVVVLPFTFAYLLGVGHS
jgi:hypothetical protein